MNGIPGHNDDGMSTMILPAAYRLAYADWLRIPDGHRCEIIEGELFMTPTPSIRHQRVSRRLGTRLTAFSKVSSRLSAPP
jgi:hypothetical protein